VNELLVGVGECLIISDDGAQVTLVFSERNLAVHPFDDLIVIDLFLNAQFRQFR
jgi:hypothetical protein